MKIVLKKRPVHPTIIQGFPGFGLVGTIATEFLIEHLKAELIGEFHYDELPVTVAIHKGELVKPMAVYYAKDCNLIILHTILNVAGFEWKISEEIVNMAKMLEAKEIVCIEGVASPSETDVSKVFWFGKPKLEQYGGEPINESIIMGVTAAILLKFNNVSCFFAETHSSLPDSKAAAKIIEILDKYLNLKVDYEPLIKQAEEFEKKIRGIMQQTSKLNEEKQQKEMSYLG
jgi:uncharacterized protein